VAGALAKLRLGTPASKAKAKAAAAAAPPADDAALASAVDPPMTRLLKLAAHPPAAPLFTHADAAAKVMLSIFEVCFETSSRHCVCGRLLV
jgi:hypothetical protein